MAPPGTSDNDEAMAQLLTVPYLGTAEQEVLLVDWLVDEQEAFRRGQPLLVLETLKASFEIEAEADGVLLRRLEPAGRRVPVHAPLGAWGLPGSQLDETELQRLLATHANTAQAVDGVDMAGTPPAPRAMEATVAASPAARARARELGVDLACVEGTGSRGLIRVEDVERVAAAAKSDDSGEVDTRFLAHLRGNLEEFALLASSFKVSLYRKHGAVIGQDVELAPGAVILADRLVLGAGVRFGAGCRVEAEEIIAGTLTQLGPRCHVRCRRVRLGENAFFASDVEIGGGGAMDPQAELVVGSHGFVGEHVHLNPCRPIVIGDQVVISRNAVVMTHSFGGSILEGHPGRFAGVTIGDGAQIGIGAILFPGVSVGAGAILLSGSSLVTAVPAGRLWGGVPAKDLRAATTPLAAGEVLGVAQGLVEEFAHQLELRGFSIRVSVEGEERQVVVDHEGQRHRLHFAPLLPTEEYDLFAEDVRVCLEAGEAAWGSLPPELVAIDLGGPRIRGQAGPLTAAFREFLRKRGVRLAPRTWTYDGGWL